jgi:hypothetical protein
LPQRLEIYSSPVKMVLLVSAGIAMTALSYVIAFHVMPGVGKGSFHEFFGYAGLVFFGLGTLVIIWRALTAHGVIVSMDAQGIKDIRITEKVIPWSAVRDISTFEMRRQKMMLLAVDPEFERQLNFSRLARLAREASRALGADGLCVTAQGLKISYEKLFSTATAFWNASR